MTEFKELDNGVVTGSTEEVASSAMETAVEDEKSLDFPDEVTDPASQLSGSNESQASRDHAEELLSSGIDDLRDAVIAADDPEDVEDNQAQEEDDGESLFRDSAIQSSATGIVMVPLDEIEDEDKATYAREQKSSIVIDEYVEVIRSGNGGNFPPVILDRATANAVKKRIVDGAHRVAAFKKYRQKCQGFMQDYEKALAHRGDEDVPDEPAPSPPPPAPDSIPAKYVDIPKNIPRILVGYSFNKSHGLRPLAQDRIKTAKAAYLENRGIPITTLANHLGVSVKLVRSDIKKLVDEYEALKFGHLAKRGSEGATAAEIAAELAEQFPFGKGLSESTVARKLDEIREGLSGRPKKEKKPKTVKGKGATQKSEQGTPPYPPPASAEKTAGAQGASPGKSATSSSDAAGTSAPTAKPATSTTSTPAKASASTPNTGTAEGVSMNKPVATSAAAPASATAQPPAAETSTPADVPDSITATDGTVVTIDDCGYSLFLNGLEESVNIIPYDLWDYGSPLLTIFVNVLYFFTSRGDQVVAVTPADNESFTVVCTSMDRKFGFIA